MLEIGIHYGDVERWWGTFKMWNLERNGYILLEALPSEEVKVVLMKLWVSSLESELLHKNKTVPTSVSGFLSPHVTSPTCAIVIMISFPERPLPELEQCCLDFQPF